MSKQRRSGTPATSKARQGAKTNSASVFKATSRARGDRKKAAPDGPPKLAQAVPTLATRSGTKQALVIELLSRPSGATLDDLVGATGWLPHTTRAALTGLRKKGYALDKSKNVDGKTTYRISKAPSSTRTAREAA